MKRFVYLLALLIISGSSVFAEESLINDQANLLYAENRIEEAFNLLLTIPSETRTPMNWLLLGNILQDKGRLEDADFMFSQAAVNDVKFYKAAYNLGNLYLEQDKPNMAIEQYKKVLKLKPDFAYAYYNMGCAYLKLGKLRDARRNFLYAIDYNSTVADFHYNMAYTCKKLNKPKDAQIYLDYYNKITRNEN
ncbi:MAG: tetratricopeptide repeat protein [Brachyspira sp.]|uniref:tetratricopeptide repeat protein n=1 Tax=Candidatus Scatousia sp. TaxID=3085663 RepID=UPI004024EF5B|nr:tetratricopeptide repeat protein [Brachyspira sp.]